MTQVPAIVASFPTESRTAVQTALSHLERIERFCEVEVKVYERDVPGKKDKKEQRVWVRSATLVPGSSQPVQYGDFPIEQKAAAEALAEKYRARSRAYVLLETRATIDDIFEAMSLVQKGDEK